MGFKHKLPKYAFFQSKDNSSGSRSAIYWLQPKNHAILCARCQL